MERERAKEDSDQEIEERLSRQINFILEVDKAKRILRQTLLLDKSRRENDAEHSWHLAVMAVLLQEHAEEKVDITQVVKMLLVHDIVEIDAGDTFAYDKEGHLDKREREQQAADRIFSLLPEDQAADLRSLWEEFEARETPEAKFAASLDRLQPILHNFYTQGATWREHGISAAQVVDFNHHMKNGSRTLWDHTKGLIKDAVRRGYLKGDDQ